MKIYLRDRSPKLVAAWERSFKDIPDVEVSQGGIFEGPKANAIVSPANSFGFMDGGIDQVYTNRFGAGLSRYLRTRINHEHGGELLVGQALVVTTQDREYPYLVSAPTMRVPMDVSLTPNAYLAFRAALRASMGYDYNAGSMGRIDSILCPGLGTGVGGLSADLCALQMRMAYDNVFNANRPDFRSLQEAVIFHASMVETSR